jgi:hypothetical protein
MDGGRQMVSRLGCRDPGGRHPKTQAKNNEHTGYAVQRSRREQVFSSDHEAFPGVA